MITVITGVANFTAAPELQESSKGVKYCRARIACNYWKGNLQETSYFNFTMFGKLAERICNLATKGSKISYVGKLTNNTYTDSEGVKHSEIAIEAIDAEVISGYAARGNDNDIVPTPLSEFDGGDIPF